MTEYLYRVSKYVPESDTWEPMDRRYVRGQMARTYSTLGTAKGVRSHLQNHHPANTVFRIERVPNESWEFVDV